MAACPDFEILLDEVGRSSLNRGGNGRAVAQMDLASERVGRNREERDAGICLTLCDLGDCLHAYHIRHGSLRCARRPAGQDYFAGEGVSDHG
ncbi:MAG: hypothetical protein BWY92_00346 [Firmicutes bacterium ADurb.BinA052]|nr:MAG: hypothetical protein BWY92_00346 [Firmicutes bacterium ADurb.BinA052]